MADYIFSELNATDLVPGGSTTAPLTLHNRGTVALTAALSGIRAAGPPSNAADAALRDAAQLSIQEVSAPEQCQNGPELGGVLLYNGPLSATATFQQPLPLLPPAAAGPSERSLCVRLSLPANAPQAAAGGALTLVLTFTGEQA